MAGSKQYRVPCHCLDTPERTSPKKRCFHSEVTPNNVSYWTNENRVPSDVKEGDLTKWLNRRDDRHLIVCNSCRAIKFFEGADLDVIHDGEPYASSFTFPGDPYANDGQGGDQR